MNHNLTSQRSPGINSSVPLLCFNVCVINIIFKS